MRNLIFTAATVLAFSATGVFAQSTGTVTSPSVTQQTPPWQEKQKALIGELTKTIADADNLLATANKMVTTATGKEKTMIMETITGITRVKTDLSKQVTLVKRATEKTATTVFSKANEVNVASKRSLERYRLELSTKPTTTTPGTKPTASPTDTKPTIPAQTK